VFARSPDCFSTGRPAGDKRTAVRPIPRVGYEAAVIEFPMLVSRTNLRISVVIE